MVVATIKPRTTHRPETASAVLEVLGLARESSFGGPTADALRSRSDLSRPEIEDAVAYLVEHETDALLETICTRDLSDVACAYLHLEARLVLDDREPRAYLVTATALGRDGDMAPVGITTIEADNPEAWTRFLLSLLVRGLTDVDIVASTCADSVREAVSAVFPGARWRPAGPLSAFSPGTAGSSSL